MENVNKVVIEEADIQEAEFTPEELADETIDWKTRAQELKGLNRRRASKLAKAKEAIEQFSKVLLSKPEPPVKEPEPKVKNEFDDTENLLLDVKNIPQEDRDYLFKEHQSTGKNLRSLLGFKYVQEYLDEQKQKRDTEAGLPSGNNRAGGAQAGTAEGWLAKIESGKANLMDIPDFKLRSEVIKLRERNDKSSNRPNW